MQLDNTDDVYCCATHGDYPSTTNNGMGAQSACPKCRIEAAQRECAFRGEWQRVRRWERSEIPVRFGHATLEAWKASTPAQLSAHRVVSTWCSKIPELNQGVGLYFSGPPGVGKTHLAVACLIEALRRSTWSVLYAQWGTVLSSAKAAYRARHSDAADPFKDLYTYQLVVLDELGVRAGTDFDSGALFDLIDYRYREGLPTIAVTNATGDTAAALLGERVVDRLREMAVPVAITGASMRTAPRGTQPAQPPFPMPPEFVEVPECYRGTNRTVRIARDGQRAGLAPLASRGAR